MLSQKPKGGAQGHRLGMMDHSYMRKKQTVKEGRPVSEFIFLFLFSILVANDRVYSVGFSVVRCAIALQGSGDVWRFLNR